MILRNLSPEQDTINLLSDVIATDLIEATCVRKALFKENYLYDDLENGELVVWYEAQTPR